MTPQQMLHHDENRDIVARVVHKWRRYHFLSEADQRRLMIALQNMRMSCDSTFLLDHETDHGVKADELATLLEEIYEDPTAKVVIFSQWVRMHQLLERRLRERGWQYVLFHGGVDGQKRKGLIDRFRNDAECRAFLSTDAGGVGLNLQHASVVVNVDMPWNPAVLEQRIGRVHRLGQTQPVRVINFVAQGTIEEGMLSVIGFKKSLFAGVLDGGEKEVFLGGTRLKKFIETVDRATGAIPTAGLSNAESIEEETNGRESPGDNSNATTARHEKTASQDQPPNGDGSGFDESGLNASDGIVAGVISESVATDGIDRGDLSADAPVDGGATEGGLSSQREAVPPTAPPTAAPPTAAVDPMAGLLESGIALVGELVSAYRKNAQGSGAPSPVRVGAVEIERDERDGGSSLRIRLPNADVVEKAVQGLAALLAAIRG
jgi:hypothetical protein